MGKSPWDYDEEDQGKTVVDGAEGRDDRTVPMDDDRAYQGGHATPYAGSYDKTVADDSRPFQRTHPQDHPTPTGPVGRANAPRYEAPYQQSPFEGYAPPPTYQPAPPLGRGQPPAGATEGRTVIMPSGVPETQPLAWLAVVEGPGAPRGEVFRLGSDTVLGRTQDNHIPLSGDHAISSRHLKIKLEADEEKAEAPAGGRKVFVLYDQGSANGTYAGSYQACKAAENRVYRHVLADGDFLLIGETLLVFKMVETEPVDRK